MTVTQDLISFALGPIAPSARAHHILRLSALDWAACGRGGAEEGLFSAWALGLRDGGDRQGFDGGRLSGTHAALVNGALSHALDFDDTHFAHIGHPSVVIFSAVLAAGPKDWVIAEEAAFIGIEASIRVGVYLGRGHYQQGFHQTATAGAFGAVLAVARVLGLTVKETRAAVGLCATMASGLKAQFGTMGKPLNAGLAARAGVEAAFWARAGMTGPEQGIEAFAKAHQAKADCSAFDRMGLDWQIDRLSHKFHACCHGLHATLEALRGRPEGVVTEIDVRTHPRWMPVCNIETPRTGLEAKFSYRQVVAMTLDGLNTGDVAAFTDDVTRIQSIVDLRDRVAVTADDSLSETQAVVTLVIDGQRHKFEHDLSNPLPEAVLEERIRRKAGVLVGEDRAGALWDAIQARDLGQFERAAFDV